MSNRINIILAIGCVVLAIISGVIFIRGGFSLDNSQGNKSPITSSLADKAKTKQESKSKSEFKVEDINLTKYTTGSVNVRSGPDTSYSLVASVAGAAAVNVTGRVVDSEWFRVQIDGVGEGYILGTYLTDIAPSVDVSTLDSNLDSNTSRTNSRSNSSASGTSNASSSSNSSSSSNQNSSASQTTTTDSSGGSSSEGNNHQVADSNAGASTADNSGQWW